MRGIIRKELASWLGKGILTAQGIFQRAFEEGSGMTRINHGAIMGDAQLLFRVPKSAIIDELLQVVPEVLTPLVQGAMAGTGVEISKSSLATLTHSNLIRILEATGISSAKINQLHDEFRYRGMKSLYLYSCTCPTQDVNVDTTAINNTIFDLQSDYQKRSADYAFSRLQIDGLEDIGDAAQPLIELAYSYVASVQVTDPQTEYPTLVDDLRRGFIWLKPAEEWIAVCVRDEAINNILVSALNKHLNCPFKPLYFPKSALQQLEPLENIRRATFYDGSTGTRRRLTNANMIRDSLAMSELKSRDQHDERPASGYNQTLPDGTTFALGYSSERGKIFFSRDLTVTQMRAWAPNKIRDIANTIDSLRLIAPADFVKMASPEILRRMSQPSREVIEDISRAVIEAKFGRLGEIELHHDSVTCYQVLGTRVDAYFRVDCEACEEPSEIRCTSCQEPISTLRGGDLVCAQCGQLVDPQRVECSDGHQNVAASVPALVHIVPMSNLRTQVAELVTRSTGERFNADEEFFFIRDSRLILESPDTRVVYTLGDISDFAVMVPSRIPDPERDSIRGELPHFKERCNRMSSERCATCVKDAHAKKCYLRLFGLLDPGYVPRPHEGHEYGDYSRLVNLGGQQKQLVVAFKTGSPSSRVIKQRDSKGRDIYTQVGGYFHDATKDVIGICVPQRLDEGFKSMLRAEAHSASKGLLFIDDEDLCRVVYAVMQKHGLTLDQL